MRCSATLLLTKRAIIFHRFYTAYGVNFILGLIVKQIDNIISFLALFLVMVVTTATATLFTAFAGSGHNSPVWLMIFLGLTQAIPILIYCASFIMILLGFISGEKTDKYLITLKQSVLVYAISFAVLILLIILNSYLKFI